MAADTCRTGPIAYMHLLWFMLFDIHLAVLAGAWLSSIHLASKGHCLT